MAVNDRARSVVCVRLFLADAGVAYRLCVLLSARFFPGKRRQEYHSTTLDYLFVLVGIAALPFIRVAQYGEFNIGLFVVVLGVIFYACELRIVESRERPGRLARAALAALVIIAVRGLEIVVYEMDLNLPGPQLWL